MEKCEFHQPDAEAVWGQIKRNSYELSTLVILLAWREGLGRQEIRNLRWDQIDYDAGCIRLEDRNIPLEKEVAQFLQQWRTLLGRNNDVEYVASSLSRKERVALQHLSKVARIGLDEAGQNEVRLVDLRHDFVQRMRQQYDYLDAMRISGESFSTYRTKYRGDRIHGLPTLSLEEENQGEDDRLQHLLEKNRSGAAGVGLWLSQRAGLKHDDIISLTWNQIDLENGVIRLKNGDVQIDDELVSILNAEKNARTIEDDQHVILTPKSRKPMDAKRFSAVTRDLLMRAGLAGVRSNHLRDRIIQQKNRAQIVQLATEKGGVTRADVEQALDVDKRILKRCLVELTDTGELVRTSQGYFPPSVAVPQDQWTEAIRKVIEERGMATVEDIADFLHTGKYSARRQLKYMCETGCLEYVQGKSAYRLTETQ